MRWRLRLDGSGGYIQVAASNQPPAADRFSLVALLTGDGVSSAPHNIGAGRPHDPPRQQIGDGAMTEEQRKF
jgi:hypothetical protein